MTETTERGAGRSRTRAAASAVAASLVVALACAAPGPAPDAPEPAPPGPGAGAPGPPDATDATDAAALEASGAVVRTVERFHEALSSGDTAAVLELLLPGSRILEGGRIESREEYASHHLAADVEFLSGLTIDESRIHAWVEGDVAWAVARTDSEGRVGERDLRATSVELTVLLRLPEEGWRIAAVHWSSRARDPQ